MKQEYQEIKIPAFEFDEYMRLLSATSPIEEDRGIDTYACFTATFSNKWEMDITICGGGEDSTPYVDYVLYDENGAEVSFVDVTDTLVPAFYILYEDTEYIVQCIREE
jgi:hypothetical protein